MSWLISLPTLLILSFVICDVTGDTTQILTTNNSIYNPAIIAVIAAFGLLFVLFIIVLIIYACLIQLEYEENEKEFLLNTTRLKKRQLLYIKQHGRDEADMKEDKRISSRRFRVNQGKDNEAFSLVNEFTQTQEENFPDHTISTISKNYQYSNNTNAKVLINQSQLENDYKQKEPQIIADETTVKTTNKSQLQAGRVSATNDYQYETNTYQKDVTLRDSITNTHYYDSSRNQNYEMTTFKTNEHHYHQSIYESGENEVTIVDSDFEEYDIVEFDETTNVPNRKMSIKSYESLKNEPEFQPNSNGVISDNIYLNTNLLQHSTTVSPPLSRKHKNSFQSSKDSVSLKSVKSVSTINSEQNQNPQRSLPQVSTVKVKPSTTVKVITAATPASVNNVKIINTTPVVSGGLKSESSKELALKAPNKSSTEVKTIAQEYEKKLDETDGAADFSKFLYKRDSLIPDKNVKPLDLKSDKNDYSYSKKADFSQFLNENDEYINENQNANIKSVGKWETLENLAVERPVEEEILEPVDKDGREVKDVEYEEEKRKIQKTANLAAAVSDLNVKLKAPVSSSSQIGVKGAVGGGVKETKIVAQTKEDKVLMV